MIIEIRKLYFHYHLRPIIKDFNLDLKQGSLIHLKGPNGAGKTTLIKIIAGLLSPTSGSIRVIHGNQSFHRSEIMEYLPSEANGHYGKISAMENLRFWIQLRGQKPRESAIRKELRRWGLDHSLIRETLPVEKFSTGMKRRLAMARINLSGSQFWLLDEPISGLDESGLATFQSNLEQHRQAGGICLIVSHESKVLEALGSEVVELTKKAS